MLSGSCDGIAQGVKLEVADALAAAPRYPEGNGLRLVVRRAADLPAIRKIVAIRLAK
jgi:hypothetical protein